MISNDEYGDEGRDDLDPARGCINSLLIVGVLVVAIFLCVTGFGFAQSDPVTSAPIVATPIPIRYHCPGSLQYSTCLPMAMKGQN